MAARKKKARPGARLNFGATLLAAARAVDTTLVASSMRRFEEMHRRYVAAQRDVVAAQSALRDGQRRVATLRALRSRAVDDLAVALAVGGYPRNGPFEAFRAPTPSRLGRLRTVAAANAIERLVAAVLRREGHNPKIAAAARDALEAVRALDDGLRVVGGLEHELQMKCVTRDAIGVGWDAAVRGLRRGALVAGDDGATELYALLFPPARPRRARGRKVGKRRGGKRAVVA